jgi:hypothetical protein
LQKKLNIYIFFFGVVVICTVLYLSWLPNPNIGDVLPFPIWLRKWTNDKMNLRTAVPFLILGFFSELFLNGKNGGNIYRVWALILLLSIVSIAEIGQLLLPKRHFDWGDIGYGLLGSITGMFVGFCSLQLIQWVKKNKIRNDKGSNKISSNTGDSLF